MSRAPLSLERYFYTRVSVEANRDFGPDDLRTPPRDVDIDVRVGMLKDANSSGLYQLVLGVNNLTAKEGRLPYTIDAEVVGVFRLDGEFKHDNREHLLKVNGSSILYGALREYLLMLTGRGPWGEFQIPTISFLHESEKKRP